MSTIFRLEKTCAVCHKSFKTTQLGSTNEFGSRDLDLRPAEMQRSTMRYWVESCPNCGYVAYNIEATPKIKKQFLQTEAYVSCDGLAFQSDLAEEFYRLHLIGLETGNASTAYHAALYAAWACDDAQDTANAVACRLKAIPCLMELAEQDRKLAETLTVAKTDLMRRAGLFDQLIEEYAGKTFSDELLAKIVAFQVEKAKQRDTACYRVCDV